MSEAQNKQMILNLPTSAMQKLIRLCYIIPLIIILGCGGDKKKNLYKKKQQQNKSNHPNSLRLQKTVLKPSYALEIVLQLAMDWKIAMMHSLLYYKKKLIL